MYLAPFNIAIRKKRMLFDGGMGALLASKGYSCNCPELYCIDKPEVIEDIHASYIEAGAQVITANSLGATPIKLTHAGYGARSAEFTKAAVRIARRASQSRAYVALDIGPTGQFIRPAGTLSLDDLVMSFEICAWAGADAGADFILLETMTDIAEARAAMLAARKTGLPVACSFTFESGGRTLSCGSPDCAALIMEALGAQAAGINCSASPARILPLLNAMRRVTPLPMIAQPNAGIPLIDKHGRACYPFTPEMMLPHMAELLKAGASAIGGCCGTTPDHIRAFSTLDTGAPPKSAWDGVARVCSARESLPLNDAVNGAVEIREIDQVFDIQPNAKAIMLSLEGLSPESAVELVCDVQTITYKPLMFRDGDADTVRAALREYAGVAAVYMEHGMNVNEYGAYLL
jgi:5-methyltetrahydrofolate--homocysteine methyltransferase